MYSFFLIPYVECGYGDCGIVIVNIILMGGLTAECVSSVTAVQKYVYVDFCLSRLTNWVKYEVAEVTFVEFFSLYVQSVFCALI